jgi:hypothetical protein
MVVRRRKKARKYDGRTHGRGCAKRGRGSGEKGGKGWSGGHKQKWSYILRYFPDHFGKHGFVARERPEPRTINVGEIDERIEELLERGLAAQPGAPPRAGAPAGAGARAGGARPGAPGSPRHRGGQVEGGGGGRPGGRGVFR